MTKAFCKNCGSWENVHTDGKCHTCHYGHEEGRAFPTAATPEAVAREMGGSSGRQLVDVEFPPQTGPVMEAKRRESEEARARAENEPILGKLTAEGRRVEEDKSFDRTGPENIEEAKAAAVANVEGLERDVEQMQNPPKVSEIDPGEAGDADLKSGLSRSDQGESDDDARARRTAREKEHAAEQERAAQPARARGAATSTRDSGKAGK